MLVCLRSQNVSSKVVFMESQEHVQPTDIVSAMSDNKDIRSLIYMVRGQQVMLDSDLAKLYKVETKVISGFNSQKRNLML